jgi:hypothetical protein
MTHLLLLICISLCYLCVLMGLNIDRSLEKCVQRNGEIRLFHPAFPLQFLKSMSPVEAQDLLSRKVQVDNSPEAVRKLTELYRKLPWRVFPSFGVHDRPVFGTEAEIDEIFQKTKHLGKIVWAYKLERPITGCLLLNHWKQEVIYVSDYSPERGAQGFRFGPHAPKPYEAHTIVWPPLALEYEMLQHYWQAVEVSSNLLEEEFLSVLPPDMKVSYWEILFLLLPSSDPSNQRQILEGLFETGIRPKQGFISYLKLLQKVINRIKRFGNIPEQQQIIERELEL